MSVNQLLFEIDVTNAGCTALLAVLLTVFHRRYRRRYLLHWAWSWAAFSVYSLAAAAIWYPDWTLSEAGRRTAISIWIAAGYWQAVWLLAGTFGLATGRLPSAPVVWNTLAGLTLLALALPPLTWELPPDTGLLVRAGHIYGVLFVAFSVAAWALLRGPKRGSAVGKRLVGLVFVGLAALRASNLWLVISAGAARSDAMLVSFVYFALMELCFFLALGIATVIWLLEQEQDAVQRSVALAAMGSLAQAVAQEIRQPLFALSATLDALDATHGRDEATRRLIDRLEKALGRLLGLADDLQAFGSPITTRLEPQSIVPVVEDAVAACHDLATAQDKRVTTEATVGLPRVPMDRRRLTHALRNLVDNAIRHSPQGGEVRIRSEPTVGAAAIDVSVTDSGAGFEAEELELALEPFFTRRRDGRGLGLALVRRVIEQHGGEIVIRNRSRGGAEVVVRLPPV